jgi:hypothetical protein
MPTSTDLDQMPHPIWIVIWTSLHGTVQVSQLGFDTYNDARVAADKLPKSANVAIYVQVDPDDCR